ncbi:WcaA Glycosyltransferases involved in cell wall biogenesis [Candidatus Nanopelagicaceae bacterium]
MSPTITIVCPVRNMEGRLQNLFSWLNECDSHFQIILVLDSCTDKTVEELRSMKEFLPSNQIEIIEGTYGSPGGARNAGFEHARNEWVIFWDSDDIGSPKNLISGLETLSANLLDAAVFGYDIYSGHAARSKWNTWPISHEKSFDLFSLNPGIWRICFRRASIIDLKFPNLRMAEDQLFISDFMQKIPNIKFSNVVIYKYFVNVSNQLTSDKDALKDLREAGNLLAEKLNDVSGAGKFTLRIYGKILITQLKKCNISTKFQAGVRLILLYIKYPAETSSLLKSVLARKSK